MRTSLVLLGVLIVGLPVLARPADAADLTPATLVHQDRRRTYHVYAPPGHDRKTPVPLVLALHGGGGNGRNFDRSTNGQVTP